MNRRRFLEMIGMATVGGAVAYSFPEVIVPQNISHIVAINKTRNVGPSFVMRVVDNPEYGFGFTGFIPSEIYPQVIDNIFLVDSPDMSYWRKRLQL